MSGRKTLLCVFLALFFVFTAGEHAFAQAESGMIRSALNAAEVRVHRMRFQANGAREACLNISASAVPKSRGSAVSELHSALALAGFPVTSQETARQEYGAATRAAVSALQRKHAAEILYLAGIGHATGFAGIRTRSYLNSRYGCEVAPQNAQPQPFAISAISPISGFTKKHFLAVFEAHGGNDTYAWSAEQLPPGLVLTAPAPLACTAAGCLLSEEQKTSVWLEGMPTTPGIFVLELSATNRSGDSATRRFPIMIAPER